MNRPLALGFVALALLPATASATGFLYFQHGGRAAAQAGAFVARADDPAAVHYNPAAIARLDGFQFQAGLDFQAPQDDFASPTQTDSAKHIIQFVPALYAAWKPENLTVPLAFGLSIDTPFWSIQNWNTALFPGRFDTIRQEVTLFELRPTVAWALDEHWSIGGALRYVRGSVETSFEAIETFGDVQGATETAEFTSESAADVDGLGFDLAVHYLGAGWGWGAVGSSGVKVDGSGSIDYFARDPFLLPGSQALFEDRFAPGRASLDFELPPTLTAGFWWAVTDALNAEVDVAWSGWSALDATHIGVSPDPYSVAPPALDRRRAWEDTVAIRLGAEWSFPSGWAAGAGLGWEPSPVPDATAESGFPRGDAYVVAFGGSYNMEGLSFDLGYSYYIYDDRHATLAGAEGPVPGTFSARSQVFSFSARWRR